MKNVMVYFRVCGFRHWQEKKTLGRILSIDSQGESPILLTKKNLGDLLLLCEQ
jgi:hypothetical protein